MRPGVIWWTGATVVEHESRLDPLLADAEARVRVSPPAESAAVRTMYKRVGLDPTKTRPSNEALLRRVRKGGTIPRINSAVDVINWCSLEFQLPYGLYDFSKVSGSVTLRLGAAGESVRRDSKGRRQCRRSNHGCRRGRSLWQSDVGFGADDGHADGERVVGDCLRAARGGAHAPRASPCEYIRTSHTDYWRLSVASFRSRRLKKSAAAL